MKFITLIPFAVKNSLVIWNDSFKNIGKVKFIRIQSIRVLIWLRKYPHLKVQKHWMQNVVYMSNQKNCGIPLVLHGFFFFCTPLTSVCNISWFFLEISFIFIGIVKFVPATFDRFQFQSRASPSQINVIASNCLTFKLYAVIIHWGRRRKLLGRRTKKNLQLLGLSIHDFQKLPQEFSTKYCSPRTTRNVCKNACAWPTRLLCRFCWNYCAGFFYAYDCLLVPATTIQLFCQSLPTHTFFAAVLMFFSTSNYLSNFWRSNSVPRFCPMPLKNVNFHFPQATIL